MQPNRRCHPVLWPQNHDFLTSTTTEQALLSVTSLTQNEENSWRFPDHSQTLGGGSRGARVGGGGELPRLHRSSPTQQQPRPPAAAASSRCSPAAPRSRHLPEEQEIRKTANANFAAAPIFPRRRGSRRKFSLDIQFPGSSSETNLLV